MNESSITSFIKNGEELISFFGYWPTFHDDMVEDFFYNFSDKKVIISILSEIKDSSHWSFEFNNISSLFIENGDEAWKDKTIILEISIKKVDGAFIFEVIPSVGTYIKIITASITVKRKI